MDIKDSALENYKQIHREMVRKYINKSLLKKERENAKLLNDFLFNLKRTFMNKEKKLSKLDEVGFNALYQEVKDNFNKLNKTSKLENILFRPGGKSFERDIAKLQQIAEKTLLGEVRTLRNINIGRTSANILNQTDTIHIADELVKNVQDLGDEVLIKILGNDFIHGQIVKSGRSGKTDTLGNKAIEVTYRLTEKTTRIWQILASSNFTLKNYSSIYKDDKKINLFTKINIGETTPYVAILGAISSVTPSLSVEELNKLFYQGMERGVVQGDAEINYHLNHLQFIYELSGAGLFYDNNLGKIGENEYLIYNDPYSDNIKVKSVRELIVAELLTETAPYSKAKYFKRKNVNSILTKKAYSRFKNLTK